MTDKVLPEPLPPDSPQEGECCQSGCVYCVWDRYYEALEDYHHARFIWLAQLPQQQDNNDGSD